MMIYTEKVDVYGFEAAMRGMRNPRKSWERSDTEFIYGIPKEINLGENDLRLMKTLCKNGAEHRKFMRMINVSMDINAPLYWY